MSLSSDRYQAVSGLWTWCLDWREPKYHSEQWEPAASAAVRERELAAMAALCAQLVADEKLLPEDVPDAAAMAAIVDA